MDFTGLTHYTEDPLLMQPTTHTTEDAPKDFVFICGFGKVGQLVCEMLDRKGIPYVVLENSPQKAIEARNKGLPVYFGEYVG